MTLTALTQRPWYMLPALWQSSMASISAKAFARLEAVRYHLDEVPLGWRDGFVIVQRPESPEFVLATDLRRPEDFAALLAGVDAIASQMPESWAIMPLADQPTWYRRHGFRVPLPPSWEVTCNVLYCPGGQWGTVPAIDLGAVSV